MNRIRTISVALAILLVLMTLALVAGAAAVVEDPDGGVVPTGAPALESPLFETGDPGDDDPEGDPGDAGDGLGVRGSSGTILMWMDKGLEESVFGSQLIQWLLFQGLMLP